MSECWQALYFSRVSPSGSQVALRANHHHHHHHHYPSYQYHQYTTIATPVILRITTVTTVVLNSNTAYTTTILIHLQLPLFQLSFSSSRSHFPLFPLFVNFLHATLLSLPIFPTDKEGQHPRKPNQPTFVVSWREGSDARSHHPTLTSTTSITTPSLSLPLP